MKYWQPVKIEDEKYYISKLGPLEIRLIKIGNELRLTENYLTEEVRAEEDWEQIVVPLQPGENTYSTAYKRWVVPTGDLSLRMVPVLSDRPILVQPESKIQILPDSKTTFYVSLPVVLRITTGEGSIITDIPTQILSNTWFGEPFEGELCYAVKSTARTEIADRTVKPYVAICPILVENHSPANFAFQRLSVHTEYLGIYVGVKHLWTNRIEVRIEGEEQESLIDISESPPEIEEIKEQLSAAREVPSKKFHRKMFSDFPFIKG
jgi:hypothetical protein